ncbi:MAG TPA: methyltransferase domain-containing protein [Rugosimonospora sp.]|nr:methyltransferase domain-containing protein [Rugosimonospora sp.]
MAGDTVLLPDWQVMTDDQIRRWEEVLDNLAGMLPAGASAALIDGAHPHTRILADRLADTLHATGRPCARLTSITPAADEDAWRADNTSTTVALADGPLWRDHPPASRWDLTIWLRTPPAHHGGGDLEHTADVVVDLHDPAWPVIRHVTARLATANHWYITEGRAFFATRAATWDTKFGDDLPAYHQAVAETALPAGATVIDVGCGTGRALPALRAAIGPTGVVLAADFTPQMLAMARIRACAERATLLLADAYHLPVGTRCVDAVFAAGLLTHLPDVEAGLTELARITRPGGRLILFHPSGRAALAARHGRTLHPDEPLAETPLRDATLRTGWRLDTYDDAPHRFHATATRR